MLVALFLIFKFFGTFDYFGENGVLTRAAAGNLPAGYFQAGLFLGAGAVTLIPLLIFAGATGKSAQIPLYVWLPDAMEGPTPVSALIHAATMVTAGVYMVCRAHSLFLLSPLTMTIVAVIGLTTAFLAATIGLVQNDIKKVLAYSTVSQLGLMFLAAGVGAFGIAMFHVTTHAFFKALLFLGSGSVIHAMSGEQDMRKMGGLGLKIKTTWATMLIGTLAIAGIPLLSGFFSKDEILLNAFAGPNANGLGNPLLWAGGFAVSGMTAFYMVRMMMKTFAGQPRFFARSRLERPRVARFDDVPAPSTRCFVPFGRLAEPGRARCLGIHAPHFLEDFLGETVGWRERANQRLDVAHGTELLLVLASSLLAVGVCLAARTMYLKAVRGERMTEAQKQNSGLWRALYNKYGVDEVYNGVFVRGGKAFSNFLWQFIDVRVVDGLVNGVAGGIGVLSNRMRGLQNGYVRSYALTMLIGVVVVILGCLIGLGTLGAARP
jgi:NADH-quinone oxidoreductase subunit L